MHLWSIGDVLALVILEMISMREKRNAWIMMALFLYQLVVNGKMMGIKYFYREKQECLDLFYTLRYILLNHETISYSAYMYLENTR